jgi:hypothetical protein
VKLEEIITFVIAVYGAVLSTVAIYLSVRRDRRSLAVRMATTMPTYGSHIGAPMVQIEVTNTGHRDLVADAPQLRVEGDEMVFALTDGPGLADFPKKLSEGERGSVMIAYRNLALSLQHRGHRGKVTLFATCKDSAQNTYRSKPWAVDVQEWLRMGD